MTDLIVIPPIKDSQAPCADGSTLARVIAAAPEHSAPKELDPLFKYTPAPSQYPALEFLRSETTT